MVPDVNFHWKRHRANVVDGPYAGDRYSDFPIISSIHISNCFGIPELRLDVPSHVDGTTPSLMLLGENGVGKSSILKAVTFALSDAGWAEPGYGEATKVLNDVGRKGAVTVKFDAGERTGIVIHPEGTMERTGDRMALQFLAYGATRLLANAARPMTEASGDTRIRNLFDPFEPLIEPIEWLHSLRGQRFDFAVRALKDLLFLPEDIRIERTKGGGEKSILLVSDFKVQRFEHLSVGYQSIVALACDMMKMFFRHWDVMESAQGVVVTYLLHAMVVIARCCCFDIYVDCQ